MIGNRKAETLKHISRLFSVVLVITALAAGQAFAGDIVDVAAKAGKFNTLLAAAKAAGLVDVLKSKGPFTVFAPTDEAFNKLPAGTVESLLKPENKAKLAAILKYHVLSGKVTADAVGKLKSGTKWRRNGRSSRSKEGRRHLLNSPSRKTMHGSRRIHG